MGRYKAPPLDRDWIRRAKCTEGDPDALFVQGAEQNVAVRICRRCPVRRECAADALNAQRDEGAWGGMIDRQRRQLIRIMGNRAIDWKDVLRRFPPQFTFDQLHCAATGVAKKLDAKSATAAVNAEQTSAEADQQPSVPQQRVGDEHEPLAMPPLETALSIQKDGAEAQMQSVG